MSLHEVLSTSVSNLHSNKKGRKTHRIILSRDCRCCVISAGISAGTGRTLELKCNLHASMHINQHLTPFQTNFLTGVIVTMEM